MEPRGYYTRGYLPHIDLGCSPQFLTWHLADSLPLELAKRWRGELSHLPEPERKKQYWRRVEALLDIGYGSQLLSMPIAAKVVQDSLIFGHCERYRLHAWVVMPTHVHCLLTPMPSWPLGQILKDMKGFTSRELNKLLKLQGQRWQEDYYDRYIRSPRHFAGVARYIEWNPVKAKLCPDPKLWAFSSANPVAWERVQLKG